MPGAKLTKRVVEAQKPGPKDTILWDNELKGFGCKVTPAGRRVYFLYYRANGGTQRRPSIGVHGQITAEIARKIAREWLAEIAMGSDPSRDRKSARKAPAVAELCERFLREHSTSHNKEGTRYNYERLIERFILPSLGGRKVGEVTRTDIQALHQRHRDTPYQANRLLGLLSKMFNLAEAWGYRPDHSNPTLHVKKFKESQRERFLSPEEMGRLSDVLNELERTGKEMFSVIAAIRLLIATGARMSEILTLRWDWVSLDRRRFELPDSKTGAKVIHLNGLAMEILSSLDRDPENPHVIVGAKPGAHLVNLEKPWRRVRKLANLEDVRIHDLRHSYASVAAGLGQDLNMIGKLLGHTQAQTTHRYAHLADDPVRDASERIGDALAEAMTKRQPSDPSPQKS